MPGVNPPGDQGLATFLQDLLRRVKALETQQQFIVTDPQPVGNKGDPAHGHAVAVIGSLQAITGKAAYGIATYHEGVWTQL